MSNLEQLIGQILGNGLDKLEGPHERILGALDLLQVTEYAHNGHSDLIKFGS